MRISSANQSLPMLGAAGMSQGDATTRSLQKQIADKQKQLQELSKRDDLSSEEKMKQRQEIQKEISELNSQLNQHQVELRRQQQSSQNSTDSMSDTTNQGGRKGTGNGADFSLGGMEALLSADSSLKQAKVQGSVKTSLEGRAGVLRGEIKQDAAKGVDVSAKEDELASIENKAEQAGAAQLGTLANANKALAEAKTEKQEGPGATDNREASEDKEVRTKAQEDAEEAAGITNQDTPQVSIDIIVDRNMDRKVSEGMESAVDVRL